MTGVVEVIEVCVCMYILHHRKVAYALNSNDSNCNNLMNETHAIWTEDARVIATVQIGYY